VTMTCPACGKVNAPASCDACERCGCDLGRLRAINACAGRRLAQAADRMRAREWRAALRHAEQSWRLRHSRNTARLAFLAAVASGAIRHAAVWLEHIESQDAG